MNAKKRSQSNLPRDSGHVSRSNTNDKSSKTKSRSATGKWNT